MIKLCYGGYIRSSTVNASEFYRPFLVRLREKKRGGEERSQPWSVRTEGGTLVPRLHLVRLGPWSLVQTCPSVDELPPKTDMKSKMRKGRTHLRMTAR